MCRRDMADCAAEIQQKIVQMLSEKEHVFVAIDGRCAAGKTTLAQALNKRYGYPVVHMDDFFLRPEQRFPSVEALRQAIAKNADEARALLLGEKETPASEDP